MYATIIPVSHPPATLKGIVERITYYNDENGYTVARFVAEAAEGYVAREPVTVVGNMLGVNIGEAIRLEGEWTTHPKHGRQFKVERYVQELPTTLEGLRRYLGSGLIKGIGPSTAERIVKLFGLDTLDVIENHAERLREVKGVGAKRVTMIAAGWTAQKQIKEVMLFLQSYGISTGLAVKIFKAYGDKSLNVVRNEPYRLARDIFGIGFVTADKIARALGMTIDNPARIEAGVRYVLGKFSDEGHVFARRAELTQEAAIALDVSADLVAGGIERLAKINDIIIEEDAVYLTPFYRAEVGVANRVRQILAAEGTRLPDFQKVNWAKALDWLKAHSNITLTEQQQAAVRSALTNKVTILTGGPGTGKTTTVRGLIQLLKARKHTFHLAAPTGRAAKRLSEATGEAAQTLHRLLEFKPSGEAGSRFARDKDNPLDADLIIVDELSMIDLLLMNALLKAVDITSHLLLVGDPDQLPSVGAGNVLKDLIASAKEPDDGRRMTDSSRLPPAPHPLPLAVRNSPFEAGNSPRVNVVSLNVIFRQSETSLIVSNAHRINQGEMPIFAREAKDFYFFNEPEPEDATNRIVKLLSESLPKHFHLDPINDVQVLSPMHRGVTGVGQLNLVLQEALNPPAAGKREWRHGGRVFRVGDKVLQIRNNYEKLVFNGDLGRITDVDLEEQMLVVDFEGTRVEYEFLEADELTHAFAMSVHKAQGSEYRAVVIPLLTQHYMLLQRNLLYTGVTRAKTLVVLVGTKRAVAMAVKNNKVAQRNSGLAARLHAV